MTTTPPAPEYFHVIVECLGCPAELIDDTRMVGKALRCAAKVCGLRVVQEGRHRFRPHGVTSYLLLRESHISVHTWPERGFAVVDLLSCVNVDRDALLEILQRCFAADVLLVRDMEMARRAPHEIRPQQPQRG